MKIYKVKKSAMGGGLIVLAIVFFGLTPPLLLAESPVPSGKLLGVGGFWLMGIILTFAPLGFKLEVGHDYVSTYFLGFRLRHLRASNVQVMEYGNLFRAGGLGAGKGIKCWEKTARRRKYFSIGENAYGIEAIAHVSRALGQNKISPADTAAITKALQKEANIKNLSDYMSANKPKVIGSIGMVLSMLFFFLGLFIEKDNPSSLLGLMIPVSMASLFFFMGYTIVKTK